MIVYKPFEELVADLEPYKYHRVVDDGRMTREVPVDQTLWHRLKHYLMGEVAPLTRTQPRTDVRITPTTLYAHPDYAEALRQRIADGVWNNSIQPNRYRGK